MYNAVQFCVLFIVVWNVVCTVCWRVIYSIMEKSGALYVVKRCVQQCDEELNTAVLQRVVYISVLHWWDKKWCTVVC